MFPRSWYPDTTPPNIEKWKIPCCPECNAYYGKLEEDLLWRLGLCIDPTEQASLGVTDRVLRSVKPEFAKSAKDAAARKRKLERIISQLQVVTKLPEVGVLPNFGLIPGLNYPAIVQIPIDSAALEKLGEKIIRGITFISTNKLIGHSYSINVYFLEDEKGRDFVTLVKTRGATHETGPGIKVSYAFTDEGGAASLWYIEIWGRLKLYGAVVPKQPPRENAD
ncbi:MAG: hypothetical protein PHS96_09255 [Anaerolineales bacterium]|nr:hypothetical protein [Anaerolineales bacterium]